MVNIKLKTKNILLKIFRQDSISYYYANTKYFLLSFKDLLRVIKGSSLLNKQDGSQKRMPKVLQFPITNRCNLKCKTCNVKSIKDKDITIEQLNNVIKDKLFSEINSVGINGGEPFLMSNIEEYIRAILQLPKLTSINIISNGILVERILSKLEIIYTLCKKNNVKLGFTTSLDGYREVHDGIRGEKGAFDNTVTTYKSIKDNMDKYCDSLGIICTISQYNIFNINELIAFAELNNIENISFQLAVKHKRLANFEIAPFSVLEDKYTKMLAEEFFYGQFLKTKRRAYYFIYKYLTDNGNNRMCDCNWADRDVTIDATGYLLYCATRSKDIVHVDDEFLYEKFFDPENLKYRKALVKSECKSCVHYSSENGYFKSNLECNKFVRDNFSWFHQYITKGRRFV